MIDVAQTFRENEILLTGSSGFLGKVVLGLLLDRYPDFKHLHVLMRGSQSLDAAERFKRDVLGSPALKPVLEKRDGQGQIGPGFAERITVWPGDVALPWLGMTPDEAARLTGRISLIINCAGRVDFFPPLDDSLSANVDGVEHLIALARRLGARLLHVSTCFVCGEADGLIEETEPILGFYPHRQGPDDESFRAADELRLCRERVAEIYHLAGVNGDPGITTRRPRELTQKLTALGRQRATHWGWVNTYTYCKSLGEQLLASTADVPWTIVRPAIIESALSFPFPGWIEGGRTAAPLVLMALGGMKEWPMRRDAPLEVVPVDEVAAAILVAGALLLHGEHRPVYQLASAEVNPIHLEQLARLLRAEARKLTRDGRRLQKPPFLHRLVSGGPRRGRLRFLSAAQARARLERQRKRIARLQTMITGVRGVLRTLRLPGHDALAAWNSSLRTLGLQSSFREQTLEQYLPFVLHNRFIFECENIRAAYNAISPEDRARLPWAPEKIDWALYWTHNQIRGIQKWVQPEAVKQWAFKI
jgi:long-chain acyl-CoA synthetase